MSDLICPSAFVMMVDVDRPDLPMMLQIGAAVLYDKPLLQMIRQGQKIPQGPAM